MKGFYRFGVNLSRFFERFLLFFDFLLSLISSMVLLFRHEEKASLFPLLKMLYFFGARLVILLILLSTLFSVTLSITAHLIFAPYHLQNKALSITQNLILEDLLPGLLGFMLAAQSALSVMRFHYGRLADINKADLENMQLHILLMMLGMMIASILLYPYAYVSMYVSVYTTFHHFLALTSHTYLFEPGYSVSLLFLTVSMIKTLLYAMLVALVAGFFHYRLILGRMTLQQAASSIFSRSLFWLALSGVVFKILHF